MRTINQAGLEIIKQAEGLLSLMATPIALDYLMNEAARDIHGFAYRGIGHAALPHLENPRDVYIAEFGSRVHLPFRGSSTCAVLPHRVFFPRDPFEVVRRIIQAVAVNMIDGIIAFWRNAMERLADEAVHKKFRATVAAFYCDRPVAILVSPIRDYLSFPQLMRLMPALTLGQEIRGADSAKARGLDPFDRQNGKPFFHSGLLPQFRDIDKTLRSHRKSIL